MLYWLMSDIGVIEVIAVLMKSFYVDEIYVNSWSIVRWTVIVSLTPWLLQCGICEISVAL